MLFLSIHSEISLLGVVVNELLCFEFFSIMRVEQEIPLMIPSVCSASRGAGGECTALKTRVLLVLLPLS